MTWKIELANAAVYFTDTPLDFDKMGRVRWVAIEAIPRSAGSLLRDQPTTRVWLNIEQICSIREAMI